MYNAQNLYSDVSIRYGSVFYKDSSENYISKHKDFTDVLSEALVYIDDQYARGGGDMPEAVDVGLDVAINQLSWSEDTRSKLLFLILDAPAHNDEKVIKKLHDLSKKAAKKGIKIIPVTGSGINKSGEYLMRAMALCTNGTYLFLTDHSGIGNSHIEPTIDEYDVKLLTERLSSIIKANIYYPKCEQDIPEFEMNYPDSVVVFTMENGQIYQDLIDPDTLNNEQEWSNNEELKKIEWKYYPNPTRDYVTIESPEEIEYIYLTDLSGKILQRVNFNDSHKITLYLGDYPTGIYLLRYPIGKQWVSGKVILVR
jgi:hydroxymethylpyrimidine pyrophosphatase-like HAD family hydrolase